MESDSDETIVQMVQKGNTDAFGILVERYEPKLVRYARKFLSNKEDREDQIQEVFVKAYTNIQAFDTTRSFSPWLYRIAHNTFVNELKRKRYGFLEFLDTDTFFPQLAATETSDKEALHRELREVLEQSLDTLNNKYREPLILYFYEDMSYQDISEVLHIPITTVGVRIARGKEKLKAQVVHRE